MRTSPVLRLSFTRSIVLLCVLLPCSPNRVAGAVSPQAQELEEVLRELREVESQIERHLIEQAGRPNRRRSVPAPSPTGESEAPPPAPAQTEEEEWGLGVSNELQAAARAQTEARAQLDAAESGLKLSTTLLVRELDREDADPSMQLTLGLMQARHRASANLAVEQLLRLEQVRFQRRPTRTQQAAVNQPKPEALPAQPTQLDELRRRHQEISARLSELSASGETRRPAALQFREQRAQLNALMARLSREDVEAAPAESSSGMKGATGTSQAGQRPDIEEKDGRRIFWRASRAKIHALRTGKVLFSGPFAGYRHLLILDHGDGWTTLYGNMTECYVKIDDVMSRGSVLGEYQAEHIGDPEPFWVEARRGPQPVPLDELPGAAENHNAAIFGENSNR